MGNEETPVLPTPTEAEEKFDTSAAWDADSLSHDPQEAGNDAAEPVHVAAPDIEPETPPAEVATPETSVEEPARNEQGQFVPKKGKGKPRSDPQARVEAATAKEAAAKEEARQARERADRLESELTTLRSQRGASVPAAVQRAQEDAFPGFDDWLVKNPGKDWDVYHRELTRFEAQATARQIAQEQLTRWQAQQRYTSLVEQHQARLQAEVAKHPDWDDVLNKGNAELLAGLAAHGLAFPTPIFQAAIFESPEGPRMVRYLAEHPQEAVQLAVEVSQLPVGAAPMLRRVLESKLAPAAASPVPDSAPQPPISHAKPPINRVGGSASATPVDPDDLEFGPDYVRIENERERKRVAAGRW